MKKNNIKNTKKKKEAKERIIDKRIRISKNRSVKWHTLVFIAMLLIILVLMVTFAVRTYNHYNELKEHNKYFREQNISIQDWMTIHAVVRHYNITESQIYRTLNISPGTFGRELGIDNSTIVDRLTIKEICTRKHLNCSSVVSKLNSVEEK